MSNTLQAVNRNATAQAMRNQDVIIIHDMIDTGVIQAVTSMLPASGKAGPIAGSHPAK